jgi:hypothetical protein
MPSLLPSTAEAAAPPTPPAPADAAAPLVLAELVGNSFPAPGTIPPPLETVAFAPPPVVAGAVEEEEATRAVAALFFTLRWGSCGIRNSTFRPKMVLELKGVTEVAVAPTLVKVFAFLAAEGDGDTAVGADLNVDEIGAACC